MHFSSLVSHTTWWGDSRSPCWFRLNILKLILKWQGSSSNFGDIFYRYVFVRFMSWWKSVCFILGRDELRVFVWNELGSVWRDMRVPVYLSMLFCGLNPRTVLAVVHLSGLSKFQSTPRLPARFGARVKRVLFLSFFGCANGARAEQTRPATEVANILRHKTLRAVLAHHGHPFLCLHFYWFFIYIFFLGVAVNDDDELMLNVLRCHLTY